MSVFRKREALLHHYVPENLPHREGELAELKRWFNPILSENVNVKVHVYGPMGTGKTVLCNRLGYYLTDEAEKRNVKLRYVNINLAYTPRPYHTMSILMERIIGSPGLGLSPEEMLMNIVEEICREDMKLVIALDEVDTYIMERRDPKILYMLPRIHELDQRAAGRISLIYISRSLNWLSRLDEATLDTLGRTAAVKLERYRIEEVEDILSYRVEEAFKPSVVPPEIIEFTAQISFSWGGIRYALELLLGAGTIADSEGSSNVKAEHIRRVHAGIPKGINGAIYPDELSLHKQLLLKAIMEALKTDGSPYITFDEAYSLYEAECELAGEEAEEKAAIHRYIEDLNRSGYILMKKHKENILLGMEYPFNRLYETLIRTIEETRRR